MSRCLTWLVELVGLRSSSRRLLDIPRTRSKCGERSFTVAGPSVWNSLPVNIRSAASVDSFKRLLKTHLFEIKFPLI